MLLARADARGLLSTRPALLATRFDVYSFFAIFNHLHFLSVSPPESNPLLTWQASRYFMCGMNKCLFLSIALVCLISGCASGPTTDDMMKSWLGHHSSDLVARWGVPQNKVPDGQGGEVWIYSQVWENTSPGSSYTTVQRQGYHSGNAQYNPYGYNGSYAGNSTAYGTARTTYTPPQTSTWVSRRSFFVNSEGMIYKYAWQN